MYCHESSILGSMGAYYADDIAVNADSLDDYIAKLTIWKDAMEGRGLRVNMKKTKLMIVIPVHSLTREVCLTGLKGKSQFGLWLHFYKKAVASAWLVGLLLCVQVNSYGHVGMVGSPNHTFFLGKLEQVFNQYLVHILSLVLGKFKKLLPILSSKHVSLMACGKVFNKMKQKDPRLYVFLF